MKMLIFSDLHCEFRNTIEQIDMLKSKFRVPKVDVVINAGDTHPSGLMREYFAKDIPNYNSVLGNHDLYGSNLVSERWTKVIDGIKIVGVTLWTDFKKNNATAKFLFERNLVDNRLIRCPNAEGRALADCLYNAHKADLDYIEKEKPDIVVSHHAPSYKSVHPRFHASGDLNYSFVSDLDDFIMDRPFIRYWFHGHVHTPFNYKIGKCKVICNPLGYPGETYKRDEDYKGVIVNV